MSDDEAGSQNNGTLTTTRYSNLEKQDVNNNKNKAPRDAVGCKKI